MNCPYCHKQQMCAQCATAMQSQQNSVQSQAHIQQYAQPDAQHRQVASDALFYKEALKTVLSYLTEAQLSLVLVDPVEFLRTLAATELKRRELNKQSKGE